MKRSHGFRVLVGTIATCLALGGSLTNSVNAQPAPRVEGSNGGQSLQIGGANSTTGMTTRVTRVTSGELNAEDINQISHLAAHLITQINDARLWIDASNQSRAQTAIDKGLQLAGVIRGVLPVTTIHTTVRDRAGKVVYEDDRRVQQANVPLFQGMTRIQFLKPVIEAKRQAAAAGQNGVALSETSFVQSRVLLDVSYVQRRLSEADRLLATDAAG
ncbi:MAG: hypothetical protein O3A00_26845, partial [Planctomycetota bacterium]|nr:hypothetical protein [Planctomycetota bacterium]